MENLSKSTKTDAEDFISAVIATYNLMAPLSDRRMLSKDYELSFELMYMPDGFKVNYSWFKGVIPGTNGNPIYSRDSKRVPDGGFFNILNDEPLEVVA